MKFIEKPIRRTEFICIKRSESEMKKLSFFLIVTFVSFFSYKGDSKASPECTNAPESVSKGKEREISMASIMGNLFPGVISSGGGQSSGIKGGSPGGESGGNDEGARGTSRGSGSGRGNVK